MSALVPTEVAFGTRYGDDSGWERRIEVSTHSDRARIEIGGGSLVCSVNELRWLIENATAALKATGCGEKP